MCFSVTWLKITRFCSKYLSHLLSFLTLSMLEIASHYQKKFRGGMPPDPHSIRGSLRDPQTTNLLVRNYRLLHQCVGISGHYILVGGLTVLGSAPWWLLAAVSARGALCTYSDVSDRPVIMSLALSTPVAMVLALSEPLTAPHTSQLNRRFVIRHGSYVAPVISGKLAWLAWPQPCVG